MNVSNINHPRSPSKKKVKVSHWISSSFETSQFEKKKQENRKRKYSKQLVPNSLVNESDKGSETWSQKYAPQTVENLSVHKKKILEVETWIAQNKATKKGGAPILLLTGPSGCGKTATLVVLARKHDIIIEEWNNPLTTSFTISRQAGLEYQSEVTKFEEFLFRSGKYNSILLNHDSASDHESTSAHCKLVVLEDLPNYLYRDPSKLNELLRKYKLTQRWPLVLIVSDGSASDSIKRQLRTASVKLTNINFNPVSATLMSKTLSRICAAEHRPVSKDDITFMSSSGDIRAAINCLQFSSQFESLKEAEKRLKKPGNCSRVLAAKDTTMILFRALGKIFYCKRDKPSGIIDLEPDKNYRDPLVLQPENILEQCCLSGSAFSLFLHHNYLSFFENNPINDVTSASDFFSLADMMNSPLTSSDFSSGAATHADRYEGILSARGLTFSNTLRATSDLCSSSSGCWRPMHKPSWYEVRRQETENRVAAHQLFWKQTDDLPMLVHLSSRFDPPQKNFIREVMTIPKWKLFRSSNIRLGEHEVSSESPNVEEPSSGGDVEMKVEEEDDDVIIEEFSD